jgi:hypothetical protein
MEEYVHSPLLLFSRSSFFFRIKRNVSQLSNQLRHQCFIHMRSLTRMMKLASNCLLEQSRVRNQELNIRLFNTKGLSNTHQSLMDFIQFVSHKKISHNQNGQQLVFFHFPSSQLFSESSLRYRLWL